MREDIDHIVFLDLETTGFDERKWCILEIGFIVCDVDLHEITRSSTILKPNATGMHYMDPTALAMHEKSGLMRKEGLFTTWSALFTTYEAECEALDVLAGAGCQPKRTMMAGNSVHFDWRWLREHMPRLCEFMHYRLLDVSVLHAVAGFWGEAKPKPVAKHRALEDCLDSLDAARWYKERLFGRMSLMDALKPSKGDGDLQFVITQCQPLLVPWDGTEPRRPEIIGQWAGIDMIGKDEHK